MQKTILTLAILALTTGIYAGDVAGQFGKSANAETAAMPQSAFDPTKPNFTAIIGAAATKAFPRASARSLCQGIYWGTGSNSSRCDDLSEDGRAICQGIYWGTGSNSSRCDGLSEDGRAICQGIYWGTGNNSSRCDGL